MPDRSRSRLATLRDYRPAVLVLLVSLAATAGVSVRIRHEIEATDQARFVNAADSLQEAITPDRATDCRRGSGMDRKAATTCQGEGGQLASRRRAPVMRRWLLAATAGSVIAAAAPPSLAGGGQAGTAAEREFLSRPRRLTVEGGRAGEGYWSPDGRRMVFQSEREPGNPFYQIYVLDLESGDVARISPGHGKTTCAFFRPGTDEILFSSTHADPRSVELQKAELDFRASGQQRRYAWDYDEAMDIYVWRETTKRLVRLTDARGYDAEASYSPDGAWIVFASTRQAYTEALDDDGRKRLAVDPSYFGEIYLMRADGTDVRRLTSVPGYDGGPFFTHDGTRIVWRRFDERGLIADVWSMKPDGSDARQLTDFGAMSWAPYEHPSGEYIVFASNKLGFENFELFIVDRAGTKQPVRITDTDGFDGLPVPSPDGRRLAWTSTRGGGSGGQIYLAEWNHDRAREALRAAPAR